MNKQQTRFYKLVLEYSIMDEVLREIIRKGVQFYKNVHSIINPKRSYLKFICHPLCRRKEISEALCKMEEIIIHCLSDKQIKKKVENRNSEFKQTTYYMTTIGLRNFCVKTDGIISDIICSWREYFLGFDEKKIIEYIDYHKNFEIFYNNIYGAFSDILHFYLSNRKIKQLKKDISFYSKNLPFYISTFCSRNKISRYLENPLENTPCWDIVFCNLHERIGSFL